MGTDVFMGDEHLCTCPDDFNAGLVHEVFDLWGDFKKIQDTFGLEYAIKKLEGKIIYDEVRKCLGNKTLAAQHLRMKRTTLVEKYQKIISLSL